MILPASGWTTFGISDSASLLARDKYLKASGLTYL